MLTASPLCHIDRPKTFQILWWVWFGACGFDHKRQDFKLKYYNMMIQHALLDDSYWMLRNIITKSGRPLLLKKMSTTREGLYVCSFNIDDVQSYQEIYRPLNMLCIMWYLPCITTNGQICFITSLWMPPSQNLSSISAWFTLVGKGTCWTDISNLVKCFTMRELMQWPSIESLYGKFLRKTPVFSLDKH